MSARPPFFFVCHQSIWHHYERIKVRAWNLYQRLCIIKTRRKAKIFYRLIAVNSLKVLDTCF